MVRRRNLFVPAGWGALVASGPAAVVVPAAGSVFLILAFVASALGVARAWSGASPYRGRLLGAVCLALSATALGLLVLAPLAVPSTEREIAVGGATRSYRIHAPGGDGAAGPRPALVVLHGLMQSAHGIELVAGVDRLAAEHDLLAVYPEGFRRSWNDTDPTRPATRARIDDVAFLDALIDELVRDHGADPSRIYVAGFSNGGFFAARLACELPGRIAGIAAVGAGVTDSFPTACAPDPAVTAVFVLGTDDPLVPWATFGSSASSWAERLRCAGTPERTALADRVEDGTSASRIRYGSCDDGAEVVQLTIHGGGHTWPGGVQYLPRFLIGRTGRDVDATDAIWRVLADHAREVER